MKVSDDQVGGFAGRSDEITRLRERMDLLRTANDQLGSSLEAEAVLRVVLETSKSLTSAQFGAISLVREEEQLEHYMTSGLTVDRARTAPNAAAFEQVFARLSAAGTPQRTNDLTYYLRECGLPLQSAPTGFHEKLPGLAAPILSSGERLGYILLAGTERGSDFTEDDFRILQFITSQASVAISNARQKRKAMRALCDLEALVNTVPIGVVVFDSGSRIPTSFNPEAVRISHAFGQKNQSPLQHLAELLIHRPPADGNRENELPLIDLVGTGETVRGARISIANSNRLNAQVVLDATPVKSAGGNVESVVVTLQDSTDLEELNRVRAAFLAMLSYELRTPLTSITGCVATLLESSSDLDPAELLQFFRIIKEQADQMRGMISDLADGAHIEAGTLSVNPAPVRVIELVEDARRRVLNEKRRDNLSLIADHNLPLVLADRQRIVQVIGNLLSYAARNSPEDSKITVAANLDGEHVAISVIDQGQGLPPERMTHFFRFFWESDASEGIYRPVGSELSLANCRGVVEAHGGRIWVDSDGPGLGSRFTFTLPIKEGGGEGLEQFKNPIGPTRSSIGNHGVRVLAVDDDPQSLRYVRIALSRAGFAPIVTGEPKDVLALIRKQRPHLVLLDLMLPNRDGIELMSDILKEVDVPIIFVSVYDQEDVIANAFELGAADYVVKPFSPTELIARIRAALRSRNASGGQARAASYLNKDLFINFSRRSVAVNGDAVKLTATEYAVLFELSVESGRVLTYDQLLYRVWGPDRVGDTWLVRDIVKRLRRKLGDNARKPTYVHTELGVGYRVPKEQSMRSARTSSN